MSKSLRLVHCLLLVALTLGAAAQAATSDQNRDERARLNQYVKPDGSSYFTLSLTPSAVTATNPHDVVVLFDTSASQTSSFRKKALASLSTLLENLKATDRVRLMAVDLDAVALTKSFVAPDAKEMSEAIVALKQRVPLGSTDMPAVLTAAADSYRGQSGHARSIVYIGDGMSTASFLGTDEFRALVDLLVSQRIAISSYAIGPRLDGALLAALANQTGGLLAVDRETLDPREAGIYLASAARGVVLWPIKSELPKSLTEIYPARVPPLRADRDTVVIGRGTIARISKVRIQAEVEGKPMGLEWTVRPAASNEDYAFLPALVDAAKADRGLSLTTLGTAGLDETRRNLASAAQRLTQLGAQAAAVGNLDNAERLADEALRRDPSDPNALTIKRHLERVRAGKAKAGGLKGELKLGQLRNDQAPPPSPPTPADPDTATSADEAAPETDAAPPAEAPPVDEVQAEMEDEGSFLESVETRNRIMTEQIRTDVENAIRDARDQMASNPERAHTNLKMALENVARSPELNAEVRAQLRDQLVNALQEAKRRAVVKDELDQEAQAALAAARERERIVSSLARDQEKVKQLMDRFDSLMEEGKYLLAEEAAAVEVTKMLPLSSMGPSAELNSRMLRYTQQALDNRIKRQKGVVDALATVEDSHIPFPDDQPVVYPDAEVWQELTNRREKWRKVHIFDAGTREREIYDKLSDTATFEYVEQPLTEVIADLEAKHSIEIELDTKALEDAGASTDTPITKNLRGISLKSALRLLLGGLDLTYIIKDEVLLITTPEKANAELITRVYPVADLVIPVESQGLGGLGGFGGGMLGGGGGGQQGGGGGFGGGGGGFGGGGQQGGGGGGFFSVPDAGAGRSGALKADLKLGSKQKTVIDNPKTANSAEPKAANVAARRSSKTSSKRGRTAATIQLQIPSGADAEMVWNDYFAKHTDVEPALVRSTVRALMRQKKYDELIAMLYAALRQGQPQPWMYEAMGLAMQADGRSTAEIERTLMSAVDFSDSPQELMYAAQYMARCGLEKRALKLFKQVAQRDPSRVEPLVYGLKLAQRMDDLEGMKWATVGILSQAWPLRQREVWESAMRLAHATLEQLKSQQQTDEAKSYQNDLEKALVRDCRVVVTWTGDADVDVLVEEPSGTVCSFRNPRTSAGGVILGDTASRTGKASAQGYSEVYVCPKAFSGSYRVLLRRVWGTVTAGKVTVEVYTHEGTPEGKVTRKQVALGELDSLVVFDLKDGRRNEPLAQSQLASAAADQMQVNQAILAQQLNGLAGASSASSNFAGSRNGLAGFPFVRKEVGFQPVIVALPSGATLAVTGVVSADRRYVRISPTPFFSQIGQVTTFNVGSGESMDQGTPGGQGGFGGGGGGFGGGGGGGGGQGGGGGVF